MKSHEYIQQMKKIYSIKLFKFIDTILYFLNDLKQSMSNLEIFDFFKNNKRILNFLLQNEIIFFDEYVLNSIFFEKDYRYFFHPEIKSLINDEKRKSIENEEISLQDDNF